MKQKRISIIKDRLLLVEGMDEIQFFNSYFKFLEIDNIQVIEVKGKEQFKNELPKLKMLPGFSKVSKIGLIRDADKNFSAALNSLYDRLITNNFDAIKEHNKFSISNPSIGIYIMPNLNENGALEDLCLSSINDSNLLNCSRDFIDCIQKENPEINKVSKRKIQAYLITQKELCNSLGLGAQKKIFNYESDIFNDLKTFLEKLSK